MKKVLLIPLLLLFLPSLVFSPDTTPPKLFNPSPKNGTYIRGGATYTFSIEIEEQDLNTSSVKLNVGSEDVWPENRGIVSMDCFKVDTTRWICNASILIAVAKTGTKEYYYFEARDNSGNVGNLGSLEEPLFMIIDREPPVIKPFGFSNNSYVGIVTKLSFSITDLLSGVNPEEAYVLWKYENETWSSGWLPLSYDEKSKLFTTTWDTSTLPPNSTWYVFVNASDNLGNERVEMFKLYVDNDYPSLTVNFPHDSQTLAGLVKFNVTVSDQSSGIDPSSVSFSIAGSTFTMLCAGEKLEYQCYYDLDTTSIPDGSYTILFSVSDIAGNWRNESVDVRIDNTLPVISIEQPKEEYVNESFTLKVSLTRGEKVKEVFCKFSNETYKKEDKMSCNENFSSCTYDWNLVGLKEGSYELEVRAVLIGDYSIKVTRRISLDKTKPSLEFYSPKQYVKGEFPVSVIVRDEFYPDGNEVYVEFAGSKVKMGCSSYLQGKKLVCGAILDSSKQKDGTYVLKVSAKDIAGNEVVKIKEVSVDNEPPKLKFLKVRPIVLRNPGDVFFTVGAEDEGSEVAHVYVNVSGVAKTILNLSCMEGVWKGIFYAPTQGSYYLSVGLIDKNDNWVEVEKVGYFFVGELPCGNGVCDGVENYCVCKEDCSFECPEGKVISCSSGIPKCVEAGVCGDNVCGEDEDCYNCPEDCGKCLEGEPAARGAGLGKNFSRFFSKKILILAFLIPLILLVVYLFKKLRPKRKLEWYEHPELP